MARTVNEIKQVMLNAMVGTPLEAELTSTSKASLYRLLFYVVAYCIWTLEVLFDTHRNEVRSDLNLYKAHRFTWYRTKALDFQYGYPLIPDTDKYDNSGLSESDIDLSHIVKYAAVLEADTESRLIVKVATSSGDALEPISDEQKLALEAYFEEIKDAGVAITIINSPADRLYLSVRIFFDPQIIDSSGNNILTGGKPVEAALNAFMKELPFNGELSLTALVDRLQNVSGVVIPYLDAASSSWLDTSLGDYGTPVSIDVRVKPRSGYFSIFNFDNISYVPYV